MSDIQTISQGNYILHNIDAADLYVQSPLFTGISGTSAYIGWNNETVLWSGYTTITNPTFTLSGNVDDFEYIEMYAVDDDGWCGFTKVETDYCTTANRIPITIAHYGTGSKNITTRGIYVHPTSVSSFDGKSFGFDYVNNATENAKTHMTKIVGVNRKV